MAFIDSARMAVDFIERWLDYQVYIREIPGLSVGINVDGETLLERGYGWADLASRTPATPTTLYRIASHSKLFTASAIMKLYEQGRLRLDDPVVQHLDWFHADNDPNLAHVTLRELLSHSAGMNRDGTTAHWLNDEFPTLEEVKSQTVNGLSSFALLEHWKYSNMGYTILGQVIESVTGQTYEDAVRELVVVPMGLTDTAPDIEPGRVADHATGYGRKRPREEREPLKHVHARVMNSATGFSSNVPDLIRFYRYHLFGDETFLPDRLKREMQRPQFLDGPVRWGLGFALGTVDGFKMAGHGGDYPGFITFSGVYQQHKLVIVLLTNAFNPYPQKLVNGIIDILNFVSINSATFSKDEQVDTAWLDEISGFYYDRWGTRLFQRVGNRMVLAAPDLLKPSMGMLVGEQSDRNHFKWVQGPKNGPFGESHEVVKDDGQIALTKGQQRLQRLTFSY